MNSRGHLPRPDAAQAGLHVTWRGQVGVVSFISDSGDFASLLLSEEAKRHDPVRATCV